MRVLVVDDDPDTRAIARACLVREGMEVACAGDGKTGLAMAESFKPDVIILDVTMPGASGYEVCLALKADQGTCMIPVVFLTAHDTIGEKIAGLELGAVDYVTKPFHPLELTARVRAALRTKKLQDLLVKHAQIDPLTELWSRRALMDRLGQEWARIERDGGVMACVMVDIDCFKRINDSFGHRTGDQVLRAVADILRSECRQSDVAARWGGDEFTVLLPGQRAEGAAKLAERCRGRIENMSIEEICRRAAEGGDQFAILLPDQQAEGAAKLAERCRNKIEGISLRTDEKNIRVTASFGVADTTGITSREALGELADKALYQAKQKGRNCVEIAAAACAAS